VTGRPAGEWTAHLDHARQVIAAALQRLPATVIVHGDSYEDAERQALSLAGNDLRYLSASSDPGVIAGQATIQALAQVLQAG
jgi:threonine dehydratase